MRRAENTPRALLVAALLLLLSGITSAAGNALIVAWFPDRPSPEDLLLQVLPSIKFAQYVTEVAIISSFLVLLVYAVRQARSELADMFAAFGIFYLIRSVLMVLTPLANSWNGSGHFGFIPLDQLGMFPSGHVGAALLCFFMVDAERAPMLKRVALGLLAAQLIALLFSHAHYSIDIAGGILLGYFVHREWRDGALFGPVKRLMGTAGRDASDSAAA